MFLPPSDPFSLQIRNINSGGDKAAMSKEIRSFLPSPRSLEPVDVKQAKKRKAKRTTRCSLPRSIFMEHDMSKLTHRQRILIQKYKEKRGAVSSFFLALNNLPFGHSWEDQDECVEEQAAEYGELPRGLDEEPQKKTIPSPGESGIDVPVEMDFDVEDGEIEACFDSDDVLSEGGPCYGNQEAAVPELSPDRGGDGLTLDEEPSCEQEKDGHAVGDREDETCDGASSFSILERYRICRECVCDAAEMLSYLVSSRHRCRLHSKIAAYKSKIRQSFKRRLCFSGIKSEIARFIRELRMRLCCRL
jgi:hypothetical protein